MDEAVRVLGRVLTPAFRELGTGLRIVGIDEAIEAVATLHATGRKLVFYHWSQDEGARLALAARPGMALGADVAYVADDTFGGRVGSEILRRLGRSTFLLRQSRVPTMMSDLRTIIATDSHISISADGRGPYFLVNPNLPRLVRSMGALAVPVRVLVSSSLVALRRPWPLVLPRPRSSVSVQIGQAIECGPCTGAEMLQGELIRTSQAALRRLSRVVGS